MIIMLLYVNNYFVEKIEIIKNMLKDLTVSLNFHQASCLEIWLNTLLYFIRVDIQGLKLSLGNLIFLWKNNYFVLSAVRENLFALNHS